MKNLLLLFISFVLLAGCKKEPVVEKRYLDDNLKAAFNNKPGSYWIFKDSLTNELDSLYLVYNDLKVYMGLPSQTIMYQDMFLIYESKHVGKDSLHSLAFNLKFSAERACQLLCSLNKDPLSPIDLKFSYPFSNISGYYNTDTIVHTRMKETLLIAGHQFENVCVFFQSPKTNTGQYSTGFWSDSIGLVKMRLLYSSPRGVSTKVLELQRWNVIK